MGKEKLTKFTCDNPYCTSEIIAADVPRGWVRILSTHSNTGSNVRGIYHHGYPPTVWSPKHAKDFPEDPYFCQPKCLSNFVLSLAEDVVERAKLRGH